MSAQARPVLQVEGTVADLHTRSGVAIYDVEILQGALRRKVQATAARGIRDLHIGNRVLLDLARSVIVGVAT
jgi:hypothetical protein